MEQNRLMFDLANIHFKMWRRRALRFWNFETLSGVPARHFLLRFLEYGPLRLV